jgi:hypothetical protein
MLQGQLCRYRISQDEESLEEIGRYICMSIDPEYYIFVSEKIGKMAFTLHFVRKSNIVSYIYDTASLKKLDRSPVLINNIEMIYKYIQKTILCVISNEAITINYIDICNSYSDVAKDTFRRTVPYKSYGIV